jgi:hypothetical protein
MHIINDILKILVFRCPVPLYTINVAGLSYRNVTLSWFMPAREHTLSLFTYTELKAHIVFSYMPAVYLMEGLHSALASDQKIATLKPRILL